MFYEVLRLSAGPVIKRPKGAGGSAKEGPHVRGGSELGSYEDVMNVASALAPGSSIGCVLPITAARGGRSGVCAYRSELS